MDLGYLVCRLMSTYALGYEQVMSLPMRVFWHLSNSVERVRADKAKLHFEVAAHVQSSESALQLREHLHSVAPDPIQVNKALVHQEEQLDSLGLAQLAALQ